jgi:hypothetical protein
MAHKRKGPPRGQRGEPSNFDPLGKLINARDTALPHRANQRENLQIALDQYQGRNVVDLRTWWWGEDGNLRPSTRGLTVSTKHLRSLAEALSEAADEAERLGLVERATER